MKKIKIIGVGMLSVLAISGVGAIYSGVTHDELNELELDLVDLQNDINFLKDEQIDFENLAKLKEEKRLYKQQIFTHKRCILASIKLEKGMDVSEETEKICFLEASRIGRRPATSVRSERLMQLLKSNL